MFRTKKKVFKVVDDISVMTGICSNFCYGGRRRSRYISADDGQTRVQQGQTRVQQGHNRPTPSWAAAAPSQPKGLHPGGTSITEPKLQICIRAESPLPNRTVHYGGRTEAPQTGHHITSGLKAEPKVTNLNRDERIPIRYVGIYEWRTAQNLSQATRSRQISRVPTSVNI
ncbi:glutamate-gated chloride channel subunit beta [Striga asiatica]|uniref:Glutamate-gated chloride channel subunit beta n=1 Tax=Striga asiatica TaxID=4170 RepID=A0A5A7RL61_STRAF|nr:glutamate-gated chloride channel subunit beta [Striga asiatica]